MGTILLLSAVLLIIIAVVASPKVGRLGSVHGFNVDHARYSFATMMVVMSVYIGQISILFFRDLLGPENYVPELWAVRIILLISLIHFAIASLRIKI